MSPISNNLSQVSVTIIILMLMIMIMIKIMLIMVMIMLMMMMLMMMKSCRIILCYSSAHRLQNVDVLLSNKADVNNIRIDSFHRCYFRLGIVTAEETWVCKARYARYVMITHNSAPDYVLTLCEVQIFGTKASLEGKLFSY